MRPRPPRTKIQREGRVHARRLGHDIAREIAGLREVAGLSRRQVAAAGGISPSTQSDIEAGRHAPTTEVLARIASALGATLSIRLHPATGPLSAIISKLR